MSIVSEDKIKHLRTSALQQEYAVDQKIEYDIQRREAQQRFRHSMNVILIVGIVALAVFFYLRMYEIRTHYAKASLWWNRISSSDFVKSQGNHTAITLPKMMIRTEFPSLYYVQTALMQAETISAAGAEFLIIMANTFSKYLQPIHWNGGAEQLQFKNMSKFLPTDENNYAYIWNAWNAKNEKGDFVNPWAGVLFLDEQSMFNSPAVQEYFATNANKSYLEALFRGGLAEIAVTLGASDKSGVEMVQHLMGVNPQFTKVGCGGATNRIVSSSISGGASYGIGMSMGGHFMAGALGPRAQAISLGLTIAATIGGAVKGGLDGKNECQEYYTGSALGSGKSV